MSVKTDDFDKAVAKGIVKDVGGCQIAIPAAVAARNFLECPLLEFAIFKSL